MRKPKENKFWNKRNVVSLFFVLIMATSVLGMWKGGSNPTQSYNDYKFELDGNYFTTEVNGNTAKFHYLPDSVESLELAPEISQTLEQAYAVTLLFDPNDELIQSIELLRMELGTEDFPILLNKGLIVAVTNTSSLYPTLTATDCTQATPNSPILYLKKAENTSITIDNSCITLSARSSSDLFAYKDRIMYGLLNIIN